MVSSEQFFGWTGFCVSLGVLATPALTAYKMMKAGTVGSMTITFFLFVFMNCVNMTAYGILTNNFQLMLCNIYGTCSATFAIRVFLSLLQEKKLWHLQQKVVSGLFGNRSAADTSRGGVVSYDEASPSPARGVDISIAEQQRSTVENAFEESSATYQRTVNQTLLFCGVDLAVLTIVLLLTFFDYPSYASSLCGFAATLMGTIMFSGPLDQIGWIVKHKSSAPIEPMIMIAAAANSVCWGAYGLITRDPWLIFPNTCGLALAAVQALLLIWYPRNTAAGATTRTVDAAAIDGLHDGRGGAGQVIDLDQVIANAREGADRPRFVDT